MYKMAWILPDLNPIEHISDEFTSEHPFYNLCKNWKPPWEKRGSITNKNSSMVWWPLWIKMQNVQCLTRAYSLLRVRYQSLCWESDLQWSLVPKMSWSTLSCEIFRKNGKTFVVSNNKKQLLVSESVINLRGKGKCSF